MNPRKKHKNRIFLYTFYICVQFAYNFSNLEAIIKK